MDDDIIDGLRRKKAIRFAARITGCDSLAEDAVQHAWLTVSKRKATLAGHHASPRGRLAYAYRVLRSKAIARATEEAKRGIRLMPRKQRGGRIVELDAADDGFSSFEIDEADQLRREAQENLAALREAFRRVLTMAESAVMEMLFYDELTEEQVAAIRGTSAQTVHTQRKKAIRKLRSDETLIQLFIKVGK